MKAKTLLDPEQFMRLGFSAALFDGIGGTSGATLNAGFPHEFGVAELEQAGHTSAGRISFARWCRIVGVDVQ